LTDRADITDPAAMQEAARQPHRHRGALLPAAGTLVIRELFVLRDIRWLIALLLPATAFMLAFDAGFSTFFGRPLLEPYNAYIALSEYLMPGLATLVAVLSVARSTLLMTEPTGETAMRPLLTTPLPLAVILVAKLVGAAIVAAVYAALFLALAELTGAGLRPADWLIAVPAVLAGAFALAAAMLVLTALVRPLRSYALVLLVLILPGFAVSSAFYPLWQFGDAGAFLSAVAEANPVTHAVELVRFATEHQLDETGLIVVAALAIIALAAATIVFDPRWRLFAWRKVTDQPDLHRR